MELRHTRFDQSARHAIEVDYHVFRKELLEHLKTARTTSRSPFRRGGSTAAASPFTYSYRPKVG
jgi:hypothetical protein